MSSVRALVTLTGIACLALVALLLLDFRAPAAVAKFIASTAFLGVAVRSGAWSSIYGRLILLGLAFSWFGDMLLIGQSRVAFLSGLVVFLLAHIAYVSAFVRHGYHRGWIWGAVVPLTAVAIAVFTWLEPHTPEALMFPVRAYIVVISLMVIFAIGTQGRGGSRLIVTGAVLFFLSDLSVAALRLVQTEYPTYVLGLPFYYAGQVCLALSSSQSRSH
jgi:uncharacterized membrane protein YhhN